MIRFNQGASKRAAGQSPPSKGVIMKLSVELWRVRQGRWKTSGKIPHLPEKL